MKIAINKIKPDPNQPRKTFDGIDELAESIKKDGVLQPLLVNKDNVIIDGERRWKAAKIAGLKEIPIVYIDISLRNGGRKKTIQLIADVHHKGLPILERDKAMLELWKKMGEPSYQTVASALSIGKDAVNDAIERAQFAPKLDVRARQTVSGKIISETRALPEEIRKRAVEKMTYENIRTDEGIRTIVSRLRDAKSEKETEQILAEPVNLYTKDADRILASIDVILRYLTKELMAQIPPTQGFVLSGKIDELKKHLKTWDSEDAEVLE